MNINRLFGWWLTFTLLAAIGAKAQVVEFNNGDRLTGKWENVKGETISFKSDVLGTVSIPETKVKSITLTEALVAVPTKGKPIEGKGARLATGAWIVESAGGERTIPVSDVQDILPAADYQARAAKKASEESSAPWRNWKGNATLGFNLQQSNQPAHTLSVGLNAARNQMDATGRNVRWRTTYAFQLLLASASSAGVTVRSNSLSTMLRQDYFLQPHNFLFVIGQANHVQAENLYLSQTYGAGYGRDLLSGKRVKISVLGGVAFDNDKFVGTPASQYAEGLVGERVGIQFTHAVQFDNTFNLYPNLSNRGEYRFDTTSTLGFKLSSWLSANLGVVDFYISHIPSGSFTTVTTVGPGGVLTTRSLPGQNNNLTVTAGIGANF
jgi:hypothetical protein